MYVCIFFGRTHRCFYSNVGGRRITYFVLESYSIANTQNRQTSLYTETSIKCFTITIIDVRFILKKVLQIFLENNTLNKYYFFIRLDLNP